MNINKLNSSMFAALLVGVVSLAACGDDTAADGEGGSDGTGGATTSVTSATTTTGGPASTSGGGGEGPGTGGAGGEGPDLFVFATDDYDAYEQIDRHGAPEAGTAGIEGEHGLGFGVAAGEIAIRDDYNASNPVRDAAGDWVPEISESVTIFLSVLNDDLTAAGLTPATVAESLAQAGPVIVPDTIKYDPSLPAAYPNGRTLEDQVVDITLAAVLVDLAVHPLTVLADLPLNPPENDVPFEDEFPFLAPPH